MNPAWSHLMIMRDCQQSQQTSRKGAMYCQMGPQDTMPILDSATGPHGVFPHMQQGLGLFVPCGVKACQQVLDGWTQQSTTLPCPSNQTHRIRSQSLRRLLLGFIEICGKQQQVRKSQ